MGNYNCQECIDNDIKTGNEMVINKKYKKNCEEIIKKEKRIKEIKSQLKIPIQNDYQKIQFLILKNEMKKQKQQLKRKEKKEKEKKEKEKEKKEKEKEKKEKEKEKK